VIPFVVGLGDGGATAMFCPGSGSTTRDGSAVAVLGLSVRVLTGSDSLVVAHIPAVFVFSRSASGGFVAFLGDDVVVLGFGTNVSRFDPGLFGLATGVGASLGR
jgi:hypothetical protein